MITISVDDTPWVYYLCLPGRRTCLQTPAILPVARGTLSHRETCLLHWSRCGRRPIAAWFRLGTRQNGRLPNDDKLASVSREACVPLWDRSRDCRSFAVWFRLGTRQNGCLPNDDMLASGSREACVPLWGRRWDCRPFAAWFRIGSRQNGCLLNDDRTILTAFQFRFHPCSKIKIFLIDHDLGIV